MEIFFEANIAMFLYFSELLFARLHQFVHEYQFPLKKKKKRKRIYFFNLLLFVSPMLLRCFVIFKIEAPFLEFSLLVVFCSAERIFEKDLQTPQKSILAYSNQQFTKHLISIFSYTFIFADHILKILSDHPLIYCQRNVRNVEQN